MMATKQRIAYIDAMRGLTMILVVYSHICRYCLGDKDMGFNDVLFLFRLPCFFFISGWLFERVGQQWKNLTIKTTVRHKFMVQIVPTVIFLLLLAPPPLFFSRLGATKGGYWFTFALFEFFLLCIFSEKCLKRWGGVFALLISVAAYAYDVCYSSLQASSFLPAWLTSALGFLSFITWRYYLFFYIGTWVKRHFDLFQRWIDNPVVIVSVIIGFSFFAMNARSDNAVMEYLIFALGGIFGMTMVFALFRWIGTYHSSLITHHFSGRSLQYIGQRTLDIYLLHYFVLPRFLLFYAPQLRVCNSRCLESLTAMLLALVVVAICLLASYLIRLNPFLGHYLFGAKYEQQK